VRAPAAGADPCGDARRTERPLLARNVRDLQNPIERAAVLATGPTLVVDWELGSGHSLPACGSERCGASAGHEAEHHAASLEKARHREGHALIRRRALRWPPVARLAGRSYLNDPPRHSCPVGVPL